MELTATQLIDNTLTEVQKVDYLNLKQKDDNFEGLNQEEQIRFNEFKKMLAKAKTTQHIIPLKEEFKKVFPQVASHFNSDETKAIIAKVISNIEPAQLLEAIIKKNITTTEDGVEKVIGQTSGFTIKELNKAIKGFGTEAEGNEEGTIAVATFKLADYKFSHEKATPEFTWEFGKRYGGLAWQTKAIQAITHKKGDVFGGVEALEEVLAKATPEFKAWLEVAKEGAGPAKGKQIFENKRAFFKLFGLNENKEVLKNVKVATPKAAAKK